MRNERVFRVGVREEEPASGSVIFILVVIVAAVLGMIAAFKVDLSSLPFVSNSSGSKTGTEVYDSAIDGWRYKDISGEFVHDAEVYLAEDDKWVRYDEHGYMVKGWYTNETGTYYYDLVTGAMLKGAYTIDGLPYYFDEVTGVMR